MVKSMNLSSQSCVEMHTFLELELSTCQKKKKTQLKQEKKMLICANWDHTFSGFIIM